jgi:hypothetical protein
MDIFGEKELDTIIKNIEDGKNGDAKDEKNGDAKKKRR